MASASNNLANQVFAIMMVGLPCIYLLSSVDCASTVATSPGDGEPIAGGTVGTLATSGGTTAPGAFYPSVAAEPSLLGDDLGLVLLAGGAMAGVLVAGAFAVWALRSPPEPAPKQVGRATESSGRQSRSNGEMGELGESDYSAWYGIAGSLFALLIAMFGLMLVGVR